MAKEENHCLKIIFPFFAGKWWTHCQKSPINCSHLTTGSSVQLVIRWKTLSFFNMFSQFEFLLGSQGSLVPPGYYFARFSSFTGQYVGFSRFTRWDHLDSPGSLYWWWKRSHGIETSVECGWGRLFIFMAMGDFTTSSPHEPILAHPQPASNMVQFSNVTIVTLFQFYNVTMLNCYNVTILPHQPILAHPATCFQHFPSIVQFYNITMWHFYTVTILQCDFVKLLQCSNVTNSPTLANPPTWFQHFLGYF